MKKSFIKAFTLVELLVVIAILAILSTVGIIGYNSFTEKAYVSNDETRAELINRHLQIYQMDNPLNSEEDLKIVIDEMYGEDAFNKLEPQSAKYGYHYWFNIETKQVKLSKVEDVNSASGVNYVARTNKFDAKGSFRAGLVSNHLLLDRSGSEIANALTKIDTISTAEDYKYVISQTLKAKKSDHDQKLGTALENKLESTAIISNEGSFRYSDVSNVENIYYTLGTNSIASVLHEYDGKNVITSYLSNVNNKYIATGTHFVLPSNIINVSSYSFFFDENNIPTLSTSFEESQLLEVFKANATNAIIELTKDEVVNQYKFENGTLKNITTGVEIGTPDYSNPVQDGDFIIKCLEDNNGKVKQLDKLYVAYDQQTFNLKAEFSNDEVSSKNVYWESPSDFISIDDNGLATITKLPEVGSTEARIIATAEAGGHSEEITVYIVRPTNGSMTLGGLHHFLIDNNEPQNTIDINYDGEQSSFIFSDLQLINNINVDNVSLDIDYEITTSGDLFEIVGNSEDGYTLNLKEYEGTQELTITVGDYFTKTFTINVIDNSASPFELKFKNTDKYMYRLGNANEVSLSSLFALTEGKDISNKNVTFNIYDASKTTGDNKLSNIATKGEGFKAVYYKELKASTWENSTIQFSGSGVAIMEIGTGKLTTRLVVEVVDGVNVSSQSDLNGRNVEENIILLNDMDIATTILVTNSCIYGNGFILNGTTYTSAINNAIIMLTNGTIDNVIINGPVIPEVVYSTNRDTGYYFMTIEVRGGDCIISNSYISGGRSPLKIIAGTTLIDNSVIEGGTYCNIDITGCNKLTLNNSTTIQKVMKSTVGNQKDIMGGGILFSSTADNTEIIISGTFNQYNWAKESDKQFLPDLLKYNFSSIFSNSNYAEYIHNIDGVKYFNTGFVFEGERTLEIKDNRVNNSSVLYNKLNVSTTIGITTYKASMYTIKNTDLKLTTEDLNAPLYVPNMQNILTPDFKYIDIGSLPNDGDLNSYYYDGIVHISFPKNGSYELDARNVVSISKYSTNLDFTFEISDAQIENNKVIFIKEGKYYLKFNVVDYLFFEINGMKRTENINYSFVVEVEVSISTIPDAEISLDKSKLSVVFGKTTDSCGKPDYQLCMTVLEGLSIINYNSNGEKEIINIDPKVIPPGLTISATKSDKYFPNGGVFKTYNNKLYLCSEAPYDNKQAASIVINYSYVGGNAKVVTMSVTATFTSSTSQVEWSNFK